MLGIFSGFIGCRDGSTAAEYGLVVSLGTVVLLLVAQELGIGLSEVYGLLTAALGSGPGPAGVH